MTNTYTTVIEDSNKNKFTFYYKDHCIYFRQIKPDGSEQEFLIASYVYDNYLATIDINDAIYLVCISKDKGVILYIYRQNNWYTENINIVKHNNIYLMGIFAYNDNVHIFYSSRLPISGFFNIYHLNNVGKLWTKQNITEAYSDDFNNSYSFTITEDGIIHLATTWYDGKNFVLYYCYYKEQEHRWYKKNIATLFNQNIKLELISDENTLHLICEAYEDDILLIFYFSKTNSENDYFDFVNLHKKALDKKAETIYFIDNKTVKYCYVKDSYFFVDEIVNIQKQTSALVSHPIVKKYKINYILFIKNDALAKKIYYKKYISLLDEKLNLIKPYLEQISESEVIARSESEIPIQLNKHSTFEEFIPFLLDQIKILSENVKMLNSKLNILEDFKKSDINSESVFNKTIPRSDSNKTEAKLKNSSNFREKFMGYTPNLIKTTNNNSYNSLEVVNGGGISKSNQSFSFKNPYLPNKTNERSTNPINKDAETQLPLPAAEEKRENHLPNQESQDMDAKPNINNSENIFSNPEEPNKSKNNNNILKKIGEFFK